MQYQIPEGLEIEFVSLSNSNFIIVERLTFLINTQKNAVNPSIAILKKGKKITTIEASQKFVYDDNLNLAENAFKKEFINIINAKKAKSLGDLADKADYDSIEKLGYTVKRNNEGDIIHIEHEVLGELKPIKSGSGAPTKFTRRFWVNVRPCK